MFGDDVRRCARETYENRFVGGIDGALELAYEDIFASHRRKLINEFRDLVDVCEIANGMRIGGVDISVRPVFTHRQRHGLRWHFDVKRFPAELMIGAGIAPSGEIQNWFILRRPAALPKRATGVRLDGMRREHQVSRTGIEIIAETLRLVRSAPTSRAIFIRHVQQKSLVNFRAIGRELNWPQHTVRNLYWKLHAEGVPLPPMKHKPGRRIEFVCVKCGATRQLPPSRALEIGGSLCLGCMRKRKTTKVEVRCPECGRRAMRWPSAVKKMSAGAATICRSCRIAACGRSRTGPRALPRPISWDCD